MKKILIIIFVLLAVMVGCGDKMEQAETLVVTSECAHTPVPTETQKALKIEELTLLFTPITEKSGIALYNETIYIHPEFICELETTDTDNVIENVINHNAQIGIIHRELTDAEKASGLSQMLLGYKIIAIIVNNENIVDNLTFEQLKGIYLGEIVSWSEVGGKDEDIFVITREEGAGNRRDFNCIMDIEYDDEMLDWVYDNFNLPCGSGGIPHYVYAKINSIGYTTLIYLDDSTKALSIDDVMPNIQNVYNGTYPLTVPIYCIYYEEQINDAAKAYLELAVNETGREIICEKGLIPPEVKE